MLVLSRRKNQEVHIGEGIIVKVLEIRGEQVRLGFDAPVDIPIVRSEILNKNETLCAASGNREEASE